MMKWIWEWLSRFPEESGLREIDFVSHAESAEWESALASSYHRDGGWQALADYTDEDLALVGLSRGRADEIIDYQFNLEMASKALQHRLFISQSALWADRTDVTKQECDEMNFDLEIASNTYRTIAKRDTSIWFEIIKGETK